MEIVNITENNIRDAGKIHSESWKESHKSFCSEEFVARHTVKAQTEYIRSEMATGRTFYMLIDHIPVGIVSVCGSLIENLYVLPAEQRKGFGTILLQHAITQCSVQPSLWVLSNNGKASAFYHKNGFVGSGKMKSLKNDLFEVELIFAQEK